MDLSSSKVLVTGGAGLVGSHIVDELVREGAGVIVYDSLIRGKREHLDWARARGDVQVVEANLQDRDAMRTALAGVDYVFHQAASWLRLCQENPRLSLEVNIAGTFNLLEACVEAGVKKVVAASSSSVYGEGSYLPTDEDHPFNNDLFYGASKIANEQHYRAFYKKYGLDFVAFRYLNVYGPRQPYEAAYMDVIMHFLNRIDADQPPIVRGDGSATVDLVYAGDVARANLMAMKSPVTNEFFNVASGKETTLKELAYLLIRLRGKEGRLEPEFQSLDSGLVTRRWGSPKKAREMLGFEVTTSVEEGMSQVIAWREQTKAARAV
jgi:nucleoside-diphosphate-sugar epimerase